MGKNEDNIVGINVIGPALSIITIYGTITDTLYKFPTHIFAVLLLIINLLNLVSLNKRLKELQQIDSLSELLPLFLTLCLNLIVYYITTNIILNVGYIYALSAFIVLFTTTLLIFRDNFGKISRINRRVKSLVSIGLILLLF